MTSNKYETKLRICLGKKIKMYKTHEKFTQNTKILFVRKEKMRKKQKLSSKKKIEMCELKKLEKGKIRKDLRKYEENNIKKKIEEKNQKKLRELCSGKNIMLKKEKIKQTATKFYEDLYSKKEEEGKNHPEKIEVMDKTEKSKTPKILIVDMENILKKLRTDKTSGGGTRSNSEQTIIRLYEYFSYPIAKVFNKILTEEMLK